MSMLKKLQEDIFKPANPEELTKRKEDRLKELKQNPVLCPGCGDDLRENGIIVLETDYRGIDYQFNWSSGEWEYGESDSYDSEITGWECKCGKYIDRAFRSRLGLGI